MIKNKLAKLVFGSTFLAATLAPAVAHAQEAAAKAPVEPIVAIAKASAAAVTMCVAAIATSFAQSKIGSAAAGTLAERPETGTNLIVLQALPEIIVLMGFVIAFMINAS